MGQDAYRSDFRILRDKIDDLEESVTTKLDLVHDKEKNISYSVLTVSVLGYPIQWDISKQGRRYKIVETNKEDPSYYETYTKGSIKEVYRFLYKGIIG